MLPVTRRHLVYQIRLIHLSKAYLLYSEPHGLAACIYIGTFSRKP